MSQLDEILLECLQKTKNSSIYRVFDHNGPIVSINGYDETSTMDRFRKCRDRRI